MRIVSWLGLVGLIAVASGCKARLAAERSQTLSDSGAAVSVLPDAAPSASEQQAEMQSVATACRSSSGTSTMFLGADAGEIRYLSAEPDGVRTDGWNEASARFGVDSSGQKGWLLSQSFSSRALCLKAGVALSTDEFVRALKCAEGDPCQTFEASKSPACADGLCFRTPDLACRFDDGGYSLVRVGDGTVVGARGRDTLATCRAKVQSQKSGRACTVIDEKIVVVDIVTGSVAKELGSFLDYPTCAEVLATGRLALGEAHAAILAADTDDPVALAAMLPASAESGFALAEVNGFQDWHNTCLTSHLVDLATTKTERDQRNYYYHLFKFGFRYEGARTPRTWPKGDFRREIVKACQPDTLYSWGTIEKLENEFKGRLVDGARWSGSFSRPTFFTPSPATSFGYGSIAIRAKLRDNLTFKVIIEGGPLDDGEPNVAYDRDEYCSVMIPRDEWDDTVLVRYFAKKGGRGTFYSGLDYILCGPGPLHSWSAFTMEHFDEVLAESKWISEHDYKAYESYFKVDGVDQFLDADVDRGVLGYDVDWSKGRLAQLLKSHLQNAALNGRGFIRFNASANDKAEAAHFQTTKPMHYFKK